jgi:hypothetical protein
MACIRITLALTLLSLSVHAQTFAEWFSQGKTQKKYLLAQIAALNTYSSFLRTGYNVAKGGLGSISSYVGDELKLHTVYYDRLKNVDPALKANPKVKDILVWQLDINKQTKNWSGEYLASVKSALLKDCDSQLTQLGNVLSAKTQLSDAERLQQLEVIHTAMASNLQFAGRFNSQLKKLDIQRAVETRSINTLNRLYENR